MVSVKPKVIRDRERRRPRIASAKPLRNFIWTAFYHWNDFNARPRMKFNPLLSMGKVAIIINNMRD